MYRTLRLQLLAYFLLVPLPVAAQSAPFRASDVNAIATQHPEAFQCPTDPDPCKLRLLPIIIRTLNLQDGGNWGLLMKTDQGNKIPADIIVWRPTMEHIDILNDGGPMWDPKGVIGNAKWIWLAADGGSTPTPPTLGTPPTPPASDTSNVFASILALSAARQDDRAALERMFADYEKRDNRQVGQLATLQQQMTVVEQKIEALPKSNNPLTSRTFYEIAAGLATAIGTYVVAR